jgi:Asp-tRNA(Asn)/Glu-tRNA(Gln) amidotransferase A subunit family amidase
MGTETLGSIVSPSVACGVTGLRPTYGRVSRYGAMALSWTMDKVGPLCRSVEDCALVFRSVIGRDGRDESVIDAPFHWAPDAPISGVRVGYLKAEFDNPRGDSKPVYDQALATLRKLAVRLEPVSLPEPAAGPLRTILVAEAAAAFDDLTREGSVNQLRGQESNDWPNTFRTSRLIPAVEYLRAQRTRTMLMRQMHELMSKWDVIVCLPGASLTVTNLTGHPQVVVPCGFVKDRPYGLLFTGRLFEEGLPMRLALAFERATEWHNMHPKVDWA